MILRNTIILIIGAALTGCAGNYAIKGGSSRSAEPGRKAVATADLGLYRQYEGGEVGVGVRHMSDPDRLDADYGLNGVFIEMRTTLAEF